MAKLAKLTGDKEEVGNPTTSIIRSNVNCENGLSQHAQAITSATRPLRSGLKRMPVA